MRWPQFDLSQPKAEVLKDAIEKAILEQGADGSVSLSDAGMLRASVLHKGRPKTTRLEINLTFVEAMGQQVMTGVVSGVFAGHVMHRPVCQDLPGHAHVMDEEAASRVFLERCIWQVLYFLGFKMYE